jgi:regulator of sigma E protease
VAFVFVLGVLIFVHELGHFVAARRIGVRVLTFSLGFGPKILSFRRGDTEYAVSAIPLGGYVKMAGESPDDPRSGAPTSSCRRASGSGSRS